MLNQANNNYQNFNTHIHNDSDSDSEDIFYDAVEDLNEINSSTSKRKRDMEDNTANPGPSKRIKTTHECDSSSSNSSSSRNSSSSSSRTSSISNSNTSSSSRRSSINSSSSSISSTSSISSSNTSSIRSRSNSVSSNNSRSSNHSSSDNGRLSNAMIRQLLEASDWREPVLITENTGNFLFAAPSFTETFQLAHYDLDANYHGHMLSRNYLLDWVIMLHGMFRFSQATLDLAVKNLDYYMQTHCYRGNVPNEKVAYILLLLSCVEEQEPDMDDFYLELRNIMSEDEIVDRIERMSKDLHSIDMMKLIFPQFFSNYLRRRL